MEDVPLSALREMDRIFNDLFGASRGTTLRRISFTPLADVYKVKGDDALIVRVELPGVRLEDVNVVIEGRTLIIQGLRRDQSPSDRHYFQMEIDQGSFERKIILPGEYDQASATARYEAGFLYIHFPPSEKARPRRIPIKNDEK